MISESNILLFPPEWHDCIRRHVSGFETGPKNTAKSARAARKRAYSVNVGSSGYGIMSLQTLTHKDIESFIANDFPSLLEITGDYEYFSKTYTRAGELPAIHRQHNDIFRIDYMVNGVQTSLLGPAKLRRDNETTWFTNGREQRKKYAARTVRLCSARPIRLHVYRNLNNHYSAFTVT